MSNQNIRDRKRRLQFCKYELKRLQYKSLVHDISLSSDQRFESFQKLASLPRSSSKTRLRNRCILTGRPRAVYKKFRISRIVFRDLASKGMITGIYKSSW